MIDRKIIKSRGNLPIPHSEKAIARVVNCILIFSWQQEFILDRKTLNVRLAKIIVIFRKSFRVKI